MKTILLMISALITMNTVSAIGQTSAKLGKDETAIRSLFANTAAGWNEGNLDEYLSVYTKEATEMLPTGPAGGVEAIEKTMKEGFWKTGKPIQSLSYENLVVRFLGKRAAPVTGKYVLTGGGRPERTGWFTTIWEGARLTRACLHLLDLVEPVQDQLDALFTTGR